MTSQHPGQGDSPRYDPIRLVDVVVEVRLRPEWLPPASSDADDVLRQLLACDLRDACEGSLPRNLERQHNIHVEGTLVLESGGIFGLFGDSIKSRMGDSIKSRIILSSPGWEILSSPGWEILSSPGWDILSSPGWEILSSPGWEILSSPGWLQWLVHVSYWYLLDPLEVPDSKSLDNDVVSGVK